jgi:hypothetical protein
MGNQVLLFHAPSLKLMCQLCYLCLFHPNPQPYQTRSEINYDKTTHLLIMYQ